MSEPAARRPPHILATEWLRPLPPLQRWVLHGGPEARARLAPVWGVPFSAFACRALRHGSRATLWLGPDEYLLLDSNTTGGTGAPASTPASEEPAEVTLERALTGVPHALVDLSHRQLALELSGPYTTAILNGACPLDLDLAAFPVDMCTRTVLAKADIVLWRTAESRFHLEVWRSFADYVSGLLQELALEFYPP